VGLMCNGILIIYYMNITGYEKIDFAIHETTILNLR